MKTVSISLCALVSALPMTNTAHAQTFDGPSIGVQAGWVETRVRNPETDLGVVSVDASADSPIIGGYAAYDKEIGNFVLGAQLGVSVGISDAVSSRAGVDPVVLDPQRSVDVTARAGYLATPSTLIYGRAGYANDRVRTTVVAPTGTPRISENRDGWLVGGGLERRFTDRISARIEYRYLDLSDGDGRFERHQLLTGITWRF